MQPVAVILSGCGVHDGSEIHESILTLLSLSRHGIPYACLAPDIPQTRVYHHAKQHVAIDESRNVLTEAARIARGNITSLAQAHASDYSAMIFPGGFGAALNLSDFASRGSELVIQEDVLRFGKTMANQKKPGGFICIAPVLAPSFYGRGIRLTIGNDLEVAKALTAMGAKHINCSAEEIVVDQEHKVVSTPAYMLANSLAELDIGITKLVTTMESFIQ